MAERVLQARTVHRVLERRSVVENVETDASLQRNESVEDVVSTEHASVVVNAISCSMMRIEV